MLLHRTLRRAAAMTVVCLIGTSTSYVTASNHVPGTAQLGGWVYIDRNNDGILNFASDPDPEYVIGGVEIKLYSVSGMIESLVSTTMTDNFGRYFFNSLMPGTYTLRQTQPVEYVDGIDTLGELFSLTLQPVPASASVGTMSNNAFSNIVLPANVRGDFFNFGERGLAPGYVSKRFLLGSAPELPTPDRPEIPVIPEPTSAILVLSAGLGGFMLRRRRRG